MDTLIKDLRYAGRMLLKAPAITALAVASLALGIGANTTIFSLINAVFLRGLQVERPEELVMVWGTDRQQGQQGAFMPVSRPNFEDYRDRSRVFTGLGNLLFTGASLVGGEGEPEQVGVQLVSANYFQVLGVQPALGRFFLPQEDEVPGRDPVAVLSHGFWQRRFGGDPRQVGGTVNLNGRSVTVVGVTPEGFTGTFALGGPDLWMPAMMYDMLAPANLRGYFTDRRALLTFVFGRLRPGVSIEQAEAALQTLAQALEAEYPEENTGRSVVLMPLAQASIPPPLRDLFVRAGGVLMAVVGLVLLIACANVANLLLGQAMTRRKEIAIRLSIGASRRRILRQLLAESVLLGLLGGAFGLLVAYWGRSALWSLRPPFLADVPLDLSLDARVLAFTLGVALATGLLFGLVPAFQAIRSDLVLDLKQGTEQARQGFPLFSFRNLLVVGQVALSLIALIGSGLFLRSLGNALEIDPGFEVERLAMMTLDVGALGYDQAQGEELFDRVVARARSLPRVEEATLASVVPLTGGAFQRTVILADRAPDDENNSILTPVDPVGPGYFRTLEIPILQGRAFTDQDREDAPYVAIFSAAAARRFWPDTEAVGQRFRFFGEDWDLEVVGVAADSKHGTLGEDPQPYIYLPRRQHYSPAMSLFILARDDPEAVLATVRGEIQAMARDLPLTNVQTMGDVLELSLWAPRMAAVLLGLFGVLALALALAGIYGVTSYAVSHRRREIGVRIALGAQARDVIALFLRQGMLVVALGLALGALLGLLLNRAVAGILYDVGATDLGTLAGTVALLAAVALFANLIPARRATATDPVVVLKSEL